jgi:hypothetical protein
VKLSVGLQQKHCLPQQSLSPPTMSTLTDVADVDTWITTLSECKQLPESDIERLCNKVSVGHLMIWLWASGLFFYICALRNL